MADRVSGPCVLCPGVDDHPKHYPNGPGHHLDCGREFGCEVCDAMLRASGERHGNALTRFMESRAAAPGGV